MKNSTVTTTIGDGYEDDVGNPLWKAEVLAHIVIESPRGQTFDSALVATTMNRDRKKAEANALRMAAATLSECLEAVEKRISETS